MSANTGRSIAAELTAENIADHLGQHRPTIEQAAVIEADPHAQSLVVAGAGSGKTETMAARVVWLLANGHVDVSDVLGLTFTRKAAGELAERIGRRVDQLVATGIADIDVDPLESAEVSTYNSFASTIYREKALLIGREPDAAILSEASAWQLARQVVVARGDHRLAELDKSLDQVTAAVLELSRALADNVVDAADVPRFARDFLMLSDLPIGGTGRKKTPFAEFTAALTAVDSLPPLIELAVEYQAAKRERGFVEFSDQIALALEICESHPDVVDDYRTRFRAVLLDEYQDTSVVQTRLLSTLFHDHSVMAVGDPDQSIYGWRGASAANLARFSDDFSRASDSSSLAFPLSTSWRNPRIVLDAANRLVQPFREAGVVEKEALVPSPVAPDGSLEVVWGETIEEEAARVAEWFARRLVGPPDAAPSAAILCRTLKNVDIFTSALHERGVRFHVLGLAGLLDQPVIADLVSALRVIDDPTAGSELLRLLVGARWNIGPRDIRALRELARRLADRDHTLAPLDPEVRRGLRASVDADESVSIVDALDFLVTTRADHGWLADFSELGLDRLRRAGAELQALRRRTGLDLIDFVGLVQQELLLDIEVAANESQPLGRPSLDAFHELLGGFLGVSDHATLGSFLGWLDEAEQRDRLAPRQDAPEPGTVQVLTIHGSKGLEWDCVAVPRFVEKEMPGEPLSKRGWVVFGGLPFEFKGDADELPELVWRGVHDQTEFAESFAAFGDEVAAQHADEQRRLAYVAVTRARHELLLSGSWWSTQKAPRGPSDYLRELVVAGILPVDVLPPASTYDENPRSEVAERSVWPLDPLGTRRTRITAAAAAVERAIDDESPIVDTTLRRDVALLLEERRRRGEGDALTVIPTRVPASRFKDYVDDPRAVSAQVRRPMPQRPYRATRLGTLFHSWVEHRSLGAIDAVDADLFELDSPGDSVESARFEKLKQTFEASPWGHRKPTAVEVEIHLPIGETVFICKLDAVYSVDEGSELYAAGYRYQVVDWKTGKAPRDERDLELKQTQLALYRLAYATWAGIDPETIDAVFYFVDDDRVIRPERLYDESELRASWSGVVASVSASGSEGVDGADESPNPVRSSAIGPVASASDPAASPSR